MCLFICCLFVFTNMSKTVQKKQKMHAKTTKNKQKTAQKYIPTTLLVDTVTIIGFKRHDSKHFTSFH